MQTTNRSSDGLRIGLAIEGGGMSGCVAAGMAAVSRRHMIGYIYMYLVYDYE
jgi:hypothetical protein